MSLVGRTLGGRYKIISLLGKGGMGAVYEAEQVDLQRRVAVKVLTHEAQPNDLLRFKQEALAAAGLAHPNIVQVFDFVQGDEPLLVMELLRGKSLSALVRGEGKLAPARAVSMMTQVLSALATAHDARIVHRDVKPENIFVCASALPYELVKVLDFGLARPLDEAKHIARTRVGVAMGTPAYMAPEQARGETADVRMDVFAAGVTLYYALAGRRPFDGKTASELLAAVKKQPPIPLDALCPDLDLELVRVVERALSKDPDARFASAKKFLDALTPHWPRGDIRASLDEAPAQPRSTRPPKSARATGGAGRKHQRAAFVIDAFERLSPPIAVGMVTAARFTPDGESAFAIGRTGLARWTNGAGFSARELPSGFLPKAARGIAFGANGEGLVFAPRAALVRVSGAFTRVGLPEHFEIAAAHVDHPSHVVFAGTRMPDDAHIVESSPAGLVEHTIGHGSMLGVTRTPSGVLVACGSRGKLCAIRGGHVDARAASTGWLRAIAPLGQDGFVAVGEAGAFVFGEVAHVTEAKLGADDLHFVRTRSRFVCAAGGSTIYVTTVDTLARPGIAQTAGTIRDVWLGNGILRVLLDTAEVLETPIVSAGP